MVDLVDDLRGNAFESVCNANENVREECLKGNCNCVWHLRQKAADEIERLREALRDIAHLDGANIPNGAAFSIAIDIAQSALGEGKE